MNSSTIYHPISKLYTTEVNLIKGELNPTDGSSNTNSDSQTTLTGHSSMYDMQCMQGKGGDEFTNLRLLQQTPQHLQCKPMQICSVYMS